MTTILTVDDLFQRQQSPLKLKWVAGRAGKDRLLEAAAAKFPGMALVGHLNFVHPNRVQVIGPSEIQYLDRLSGAERAKAIRDLFGCKTSAVVIVANDEPLSPELVDAAEAAALPLFASPLPSPRLIDDLQHFLAGALAARTTLHGVYMEVMSIGVFLTGESGIGKSELALELLSRGHRLIADDAVEFARIAPDILDGRSPQEALCEFLEVRGLGILNVRAMFGETAVRREKRLQLIVHLEDLSAHAPGAIDRLQAERRSRAILGIDIPEVVLFVAPGRNLAVLVEAATRAHILRLRGINPLDDFMKKQAAIIASSQ